MEDVRELKNEITVQTRYDIDGNPYEVELHYGPFEVDGIVYRYDILSTYMRPMVEEEHSDSGGRAWYFEQAEKDFVLNEELWVKEGTIVDNITGYEYG